MSRDVDAIVKQACQRHGRERCRLMDVVREVQAACGHVSGDALEAIAREFSIHRVEVQGMVSFYAFLTKRAQGQVVFRVCNDIVDRLKGSDAVIAALEEELGITVGATDNDGKITLQTAPCIGMCDQAPAMLVNDTVITNLTPESARSVARTVREQGSATGLARETGDGNNAHPLVKAMVRNNLHERGEVIFQPFENGSALSKALSMSPEKVIGEIKDSRLRGRGGAGFPTGMKWEFTRNAEADERFILCNADEGEPGTFKDRVLLTECPDLLLEGMTIAGYALGARTGIIYLRGEYAYLRAFLEDRLQERRRAGLLGNAVCGRQGFDFDIRIQMGAGAYICGEETALINSCEGGRGDPRNRPPFPAQQGFLGKPTSVNNVETLCCAARILERGADWFAAIGPKGSPGTKVLSVSGDCAKPGVYELPFGVSVQRVLELCGAENAKAVVVGGPSGRIIGSSEFARTISCDDLATGGSIMVFDSSRNVVEIVRAFLEFFVEESCGYCTPCRVGNELLLRKLDELLAGRGGEEDFDYLLELGKAVKFSSRCGLGQTSANPVLTTLENFRSEYERLLPQQRDPLLQPAFDIHAALADASRLTGRESVLFKT